jgi:hypothetical protein
LVTSAHNREPDRGNRVDGMSTRAATWLAWSVCALSLVLTALSLLLLVLNLSHSGDNVFDYWIADTTVAVAFSTVGAIIASRRPGHSVGWLFCAIGFLAGVDHFCGEYAIYTLLTQPDSLSGGEAAAWIRSWVWVTAGGLAVFLVLLFPTGRLASSRWGPVAWLNLIVSVLGAIWMAFAPGPVDGLSPIQNPLGIDSLEIEGELSAVYLVEILQATIGLAAAVSLFVRQHRAGFEEQQQIKWFAYAASILILGALLTSSIPDAMDAWSVVGFTLYIGGIVGLPVAVGIAILRHHLYDIDLIINRTLVYGSLTAMLAGIYFGVVVLLQQFFVFLTGERSTLAVVASTLAIAALFNPLRHRIQGFIDRRFYRRKYDAAKTLEAFSAKLRDETDLDALSEDLVGVVRETMQPKHVSLWLRPDLGGRAKSPQNRIAETRNTWRPPPLL